jgi:tRNA 2-thiocytidine biosynthesis protein TtcA
MFKSENNQITIEQMRKLDEEYTLVDIRDEISFEYGHIDGAKNIPLAKIKEDNSLLPKDKLVVLCCKSGQISDELAENLRDDGFNAVNLEGGYYSWLRSQFENEDYATDVEKSIRKKFSKTIWSRFTAAIIEYKLVEPNDKIAVCISGGKDSMLMAKLFQELKRHNKFPFELVFLVMDPGYSVENRDVIESNARRLNIPITVFETDIFNSVYNVDKYPCYLCARMRRGYLYKKAKQLGCNKIALGHHYDDVIETILMGMLYGGQVQTMMPKLHSTNYEGMELIRPLYLVREAEIKHWRDRLNSLAVVAIVSIEVHLLDFLEERISWVCTCALVIKCLLCHSVKTVEEVLFVRNIILDRVLDADSCLEVVNSLDKVFNALCIVLAAEAEVTSYFSITSECVRVIILWECTHLSWNFC